MVIDLLLFRLHNVIKQLTSLHILHYEEKLFGGLDYFIELDDTRMSDKF